MAEAGGRFVYIGKQGLLAYCGLFFRVSGGGTAEPDKKCGCGEAPQVNFHTRDSSHWQRASVRGHDSFPHGVQIWACNEQPKIPSKQRQGRACCPNHQKPAEESNGLCPCAVGLQEHSFEQGFSSAQLLMGCRLQGGIAATLYPCRQTTAVRHRSMLQVLTGRILTYWELGGWAVRESG